MIYKFCQCTGLTSATIGNSVTFIGTSAFMGCTGLTSIHCKNGVPCKVQSDSFSGGIIQKATLYVPKGSIDAYKSAEGWKQFSNIVEE